MGVNLVTIQLRPAAPAGRAGTPTDQPRRVVRVSLRNYGDYEHGGPGAFVAEAAEDGQGRVRFALREVARFLRVR